MNDPIKERVDRFVDEILDLVQRARGESRALALHTVTTILAGMKRPAEPLEPAAAVRRAAPQPSQARRRAPATTTSAKSERRPRRTREEAPATQRSPVPAATAPSSPAATSVATAEAVPTAGSPASPALEREARVLSAVRALVRATAATIAERSGQPNGSVSVVLRGLVARGLVAKTETARGFEYSLVSAGSVRPFKRAAAEPAPAGNGRGSGDSPGEDTSTTAVA